MTQESQNLRSILDQGPLPVARAIRIAHALASQLADAHLEGMVHGDLKPSNIQVSRSGGVKITGFGAHGDRLDHRNDILAFGAVLYEMLTRHQPPAQGKPPSPSELNPHVPRALDAIVLNMLAREPADRTPGAPILLRDLQRLEEGLGMASQEPTGTIPPAADAPGLDKRKEPSAAGEFRIDDRDVYEHRRVMMERGGRRDRPSGSRRAVFAAFAMVLVVFAGGIGSFWYFLKDPGERGIAARQLQKKLAVAFGASPASVPPTEVAESSPLPQQEAPVTTKVASHPTPPAPVVEASKDPIVASGTWQSARQKAPAEAPRPVTPPPVAQVIAEAPAKEPAGSGLTVPKSMVAVSKEPATAPAPKPQAESKPQPPAKVAKPKPVEPKPEPKAQLVLAVSPGGEVYVNGEHFGSTPPDTTFELPPGMYRVEVRNASHKPYLTYMTVEAGDVRRITHDFNAKPSRPPS